jgi:serine/threonine protein kinase
MASVESSSIFRLSQQINIDFNPIIDSISNLNKSNIYYVWGILVDKMKISQELKTELPVETIFLSLNEIFEFYFNYDFNVSRKIQEFNDIQFYDGLYVRNFEEISKLGEGSFGTVFKVGYKITGRPKISTNYCTIKKIYFKKEYKHEIIREFKIFSIVKKLSPDYVISHRDAWFENSRNDKIELNIEMELCDQNLEDVINEINNDHYMKFDGEFTLMGYFLATQLFIEILEAVKYLHENHIIHRDLNPCNIMLNVRGHFLRPKFMRICDFGLIAFHEFEEQAHSSNRGTMKYMAPEVDSKKYDLKADIYSLGMILCRIFDMNLYE